MDEVSSTGLDGLRFRVGEPFPSSRVRTPGSVFCGSCFGVVLLVGLDRQRAAVAFTGCEIHARINNGENLSNDEQGALVRVCTGESRPWSMLWPFLRHYD
jgi:hypothetical protein